MIPTKYNLTIYRGRDYSIEFEFKDTEGNNIPIDNWNFKSQIRKEDCPESELLAEFTIAKDTSNSRVTLTLTDSETLAINEDKGYWDLLVSINNIDESYLCGKVKILCCPTEV